MKRKIVSAILAVTMVMDMVAVPVGATVSDGVGAQQQTAEENTVVSSGVSETAETETSEDVASVTSETAETSTVKEKENDQQATETPVDEETPAESADGETEQKSEEPQLEVVQLAASENNYAYCTTNDDGQKQFVVVGEAFEQDVTYSAEISQEDKEPETVEAVANDQHTLVFPYTWENEQTYTVNITAGDKIYACQINTENKETQDGSGIVKLYADGEVKAEDLQEKDTDGKILIAYGDQQETESLLTVDTKGKDTSTLSVDTQIDHVVAIAYTVEDDMYVYSQESTLSTLSVEAQVAPQAIAEGTSVELPGNISSITAAAADMTVNVSWAAAVNADMYEVWCSANGNTWLAGTTNGTAYTVENLENDVDYWFLVKPKRTVNGQEYYGADSYAVSARPKFVQPHQVDSFDVTAGDNGNTLTWSYSGSKLTGFILYYYDYNTKKYSRLGVVDPWVTSFVHTGAKSTQKYKYAVRPYRMEKGVYYGADWTEKIVYGKSLIAENASIHPMYYTAYTKKKIGIFKKKNENNPKQYIRVLKKGTKVTVIMNDPLKPKIRLADGTEAYTWSGALRLAVEHYTSKDYTENQKATFVNQRGYGSGTQYLIWIATYPQRIYIYKGSKGNWKLIRENKCATGAIRTPDYPGEKKVTKKTRWHKYGRRFYQYLTYMNGGNMIHTRPAWRSSGKYVDSRLGRPLSKGCIRVPDSDASFIYKNCGKNTKIVIY